MEERFSTFMLCMSVQVNAMPERVYPNADDTHDLEMSLSSPASQPRCLQTGDGIGAKDRLSTLYQMTGSLMTEWRG